MVWRLAGSLEVVRAQLDTVYPKRDRTSDGSIGDAAHAVRTSDHNPYIVVGKFGVVRALDVDRDIAKGFTAADLAEILLVNRDPRITYVISRGRWFKSYGPTPWQWLKYTGPNGHFEHTHISVSENPKLFDDRRPWVISAGAAVKPIIVPVDAPPVVDLPKTEKGKPVIVPARATLRLGSAGEDVGYLQRMLGLEADNDFGPKTRKKVIEWQKKWKQPQSGIVDPAFWAELVA